MVRGDRARNAHWVLGHLAGLPLATAGHLTLLSDIETAAEERAPQRPTIFAVLKALRAPEDGGPALVAPVSEPGNETGYVLTLAGAAELAQPGSRLGGSGWSRRAGGEKWTVSIPDMQRRHVRLTTDLAVILRAHGLVSTEFALRGGRGEEPSAPRSATPFSAATDADPGSRRADLTLALSTAMWPVEIELSAKGADAKNQNRYAALTKLQASGNFVTDAPPLPVAGVWYLTDSESGISTGERARIAERVVQGVYDAADDESGDVIVVVDPVPLRDIAELRFADRLDALRPVVEATVPFLRAWAGEPQPKVAQTEDDGVWTMGWLTASSVELKPRSITTRTVAVVGNAVEIDSRGEGRLRVGERTLRFRGVPTGPDEMTVWVLSDDRVVVHGSITTTEPPTIAVAGIRGVGIDWEPPSQAASARTRRAQRALCELVADRGWGNVEMKDGTARCRMFHDQLERLVDALGLEDSAASAQELPARTAEWCRLVEQAFPAAKLEPGMGLASASMPVETLWEIVAGATGEDVEALKAQLTE